MPGLGTDIQLFLPGPPYASAFIIVCCAMTGSLESARLKSGEAIAITSPGLQETRY